MLESGDYLNRLSEWTGEIHSNNCFEYNKIWKNWIALVKLRFIRKCTKWVLGCLLCIFLPWFCLWKCRWCYFDINTYKHKHTHTHTVHTHIQYTHTHIQYTHTRPDICLLCPSSLLISNEQLLGLVIQILLITLDINKPIREGRRVCTKHTLRDDLWPPEWRVISQRGTKRARPLTITRVSLRLWFDRWSFNDPSTIRGFPALSTALRPFRWYSDSASLYLTLHWEPLHSCTALRLMAMEQACARVSFPPPCLTPRGAGCLGWRSKVLERRQRLMSAGI